MSLPLGWEIKLVSEINHHKGRTIKPSDFPDEVFELYSVPSFPSGKPEFLTGDKIGSSKQMVEPGDVLVCKINPRINRVWVVGTKGAYRQIASSEWINVRNDIYDSNYLRYFFRSQGFRELLCSEVTGVGGSLTRAQPKKVAGYPVIIAPLDQQTAIASRLDIIFKKLEIVQARLEKVPQLLKRFRMSVLSVAVSGELTEEWREVNPNLETVLPDNYIQSYNGKPLGDLPEGWGWVSFKNAAKIESNLVDPKLTPSDIHLAPNHIESNTGRILDLVTVEQDKVKSNKHRFYPGQIIYSKIRPYLNKVCTVDFEGVCSADMYPVKANINREYLLYVMLSDMFVYWTSQQQGRVVLPKINQKALNEIPVPVPPNEEQNEIARIVGELWAKADAVEKQYNLAKLRVEKLTQSILARAFRGELFEPFSDKAERVAQPQLENDIDEQPREQEEASAEQVDVTPARTQPTPKVVDDKSELLSKLRVAKKAMSAQQLFDSDLVETFKAIDELFVELKRLLELNLIEKVGEGENCQFKAIK
ncbi:restriction endonuclease subunit S [Vibrio fluvialis]|nr:restriction endonuclease subunit S [Vibrio fluvialis]